ncbi:MAG: hypothetical protein KDJ87_09125 [Rhizobiaceae bacterium]|nr:hypothetical protein [Rhizobiaceae bacterium]
MNLVIRTVFAVLVAGTGPLAAKAGVAIVQAPEQSFGICAARDAKSAFACARTQCAAGGAAKADCLEMAYCDSGWTVDVFMQGKEGNHWHEYRCGWNSRAEAEAAGKLACNPERMEDLMECSTVQIYDPDARPQIEN